MQRAKASHARLLNGGMVSYICRVRGNLLKRLTLFSNISNSMRSIGSSFFLRQNTPVIKKHLFLCQNTATTHTDSCSKVTKPTGKGIRCMIKHLLSLLPNLIHRGLHFTQLLESNAH